MMRHKKKKMNFKKCINLKRIVNSYRLRMIKRKDRKLGRKQIKLLRLVELQKVGGLKNCCVRDLMY